LEINWLCKAISQLNKYGAPHLRCNLIFFQWHFFKSTHREMENNKAVGIAGGQRSLCGVLFPIDDAVNATGSFCILKLKLVELIGAH